DLAVGLLERDLRLQRERALLTEDAREVAADDRDAFRVDGAAELRLVLDVDQTLAAERHDRRDAHGLAELDVACRIHGESVDHADARALGVEGDLAADR